MQSEDKIRVQHILDEAAEACRYVEGITFDEQLESVLENIDETD